MKNWIRSYVAGPVIFLALIAFSSGSAWGGSAKWTSQVDPSLVSEIVLRDGNLYIATGGGLLIYDLANSSFKQFTNTIGLPSNFLTSLVFDPMGRIWVGTEDAGIASLDMTAGGFDVRTLNSTFNGLTDDRITTLAAWGDTIVYGTKMGAGLIVVGFPGQRFFTDDGLPSDDVNDVFADGDRVWVATDSGVVNIDRLGFVHQFSLGLPNPNARAFARTDTAIWVGTMDGVARFDETSGLWVAEGIVGEPTFSMQFDGTRLWVGVRRRVYKNDGAGWTAQSLASIYAKYGLNNNLSEVRGLQPMADGTVFAGIAEPLNARRGAFLLFLDGSTVNDIQVNAPPENRILRMSFDIDGSLWVSSEGYGVGKLDPTGVWLNYNSAYGDTNLTNLSTNLAFLADSRGTKWFNTLSTPANPKPLDELRDGQDLDRANDVWIHHDIGSGGGDGLGSLRNVEAREDPAGNVWFLSDDSNAADGWWGINILRADGSAWLQVNPQSTSSRMLAGNVADVVFDSGGVSFVALTTFGVQRWFAGGYDAADLFDLAPDGWQSIGEIGQEFDSDVSITALALRNDGVLWIGTSGGLYRWEAGLFRFISANRGFGVGLLGNAVADVVLDRENNVWVATELGLNRISFHDESDIASFTTASAWREQLNLFFSPDVVSPIVDASCKALALHPTRNLLYIGTGGGLSILDLSSLRPQTTTLSKVYVFPNPIRGGRGDQELKIGNVNSPVNVEIYTLEGELVHRVFNVSNSEDVIWDLTTASGFLASSGVYVVRISNDAGTIFKRVSLLR